MNLKIEKMTLEDLNSIHNILLTEFDDFWTLSALEQELNCENSYFLVAKNTDNQIMGFAGIRLVLDEADIMNIVIRKKFRNNGIGYILLEHLLDYAKSVNIKFINLEVNKFNLSAICLYNKFNFEHIGIRKKYYNGKDDAIIMRKKI